MRMLRLISILIVTITVASAEEENERMGFFTTLEEGSGTGGGVDEQANPLHYSAIVSRDYTARSAVEPINACIQVQELTEGQTLADGPNLLLGDCDGYFDSGVVSGGWRLDGHDLFRSQLDDRYCMQAGVGETPKEGNILRLGLCNATLDAQRFVYFPSRGIRPLVDQTLCVVWKGQVADVGKDEILLNQCRWVRDRREWEYGNI